MMIIDTHCHLDLDVFDPDRDAVMDNAVSLGVKAFVIPATKQKNWQNLLDLSRRYTNWLPALGLHPLFIHEHGSSGLDELNRQLVDKPSVCVGEIGLDYFRENRDSKSRQLQFFSDQLDIAEQHQRAVIIHARKSHDDILACLKQKKFSAGGFIHAFNGDRQQAGKYLDLGFKLGFGGMLTYTRSTRLRELARTLPLSALVLETDSPDMTVASHHGQRNSPEYLPEILNALAEVRQQETDIIARQTTQNCLEIMPFADPEKIVPEPDPADS